MKNIISLFLIFVIAIILNPSNQTLAALNNQQEIDLSISAKDMLFDVKNMKPGDWAPRELAIFNNGKKDFRYTSSVTYTSGSKLLYSELQLKVTSSNTELYSGKLSEFKGFSPRELMKSTRENLVYTVKFPDHLGNEFQGLECTVKFSFFVDSTTAGFISSGGGELPATAANFMNYLLVGMLLFLTGGSLLWVQKVRYHALYK